MAWLIFITTHLSDFDSALGTHQGETKVTGTQDAEPEDEDHECDASGNNNALRP